MSRLTKPVLPTARRAQREGFRVADVPVETKTDSATASHFRRMLMFRNGKLKHNTDDYRQNLKVYNWVTRERERGPINGQVHGPITYRVLLQYSIAAKAFDFANVLIDEMRQKKISHGSGTIEYQNLLIQLSAKKGVNPIPRVKQFRKEFRKEISVESQFCVFRYYSKLAEVEPSAENQAFNFYRSLKQPTSKITLAALNCCSSNKTVAALFSRLKPLFETEFGLWSLTQVALLKVSLRTASPSSAMKVITALEQKNSQKTDNYNILMLVLIRAKRPEECEGVLHRLHEKKCVPDLTTYCTYFYALSEMVAQHNANKVLILEKASLLYKRMLTEGYSKYQKTYGSYMQVLAPMGEYLIAEDVRRDQWLAGVKESTTFLNHYRNVISNAGFDDSKISQLPLSRYDGESYPAKKNTFHKKVVDKEASTPPPPQTDTSEEEKEESDMLSSIKESLASLSGNEGTLVSDGNNEYHDKISKAGFSCKPPPPKRLHRSSDSDWYENINKLPEKAKPVTKTTSSIDDMLTLL